MPRLIKPPSLNFFLNDLTFSLIKDRFVYECTDVQFLCIYSNMIDFINFKLIFDLLLYNALFYT